MSAGLERRSLPQFDRHLLQPQPSAALHFTVRIYAQPTRELWRLIEFYRCYELRCLPLSFGNLCSLQEMHAYECFKLQLPSSFGNLSNLQHLELIDGVRTLPDSFGDLRSLHTFHFWSGWCEYLPSSFTCLSGLRELTLGCNNLHALPPYFRRLSCLTNVTVACYSLGIRVTDVLASNIPAAR